jgi:hypothetical protein
VTTAMSAEDAGRRPSRQFIELLGKALVDQQLRETLFADPESVAQSLHLSVDETEALKRLDRDKFERLAAEVRWS